MLSFPVNYKGCYVVEIGELMAKVIFYLLYLMVSIELFYINNNNIWLILVGIFSIYCLPCLGDNKLNTFSRDSYIYLWSNESDMTNPLYQKGYFRKSKIRFFSKLRGRFLCECAFCSIWFMRLIYVIFRERISFTNVNMIFAVMLTAGEIVWIIQQSYYKREYNLAFRYTEDINHIWQPFSNMAQYCRYSYQNPHLYYYAVSFEKIGQKLKKKCSLQQYIFDAEYSKKDVKSAIYWKRTEKTVEVLQLGQMPIYSEENMQILNEFFSSFWKKNPEIDKNKIKLMTILCMEKGNGELRKHLLSRGHVDQKDDAQGRYRLPVIVLHSDEPQLQILPLYSKRRGAKEYDEMKKEIRTLLDLSKKRPEE